VYEAADLAHAGVGGALGGGLVRAVAVGRGRRHLPERRRHQLHGELRAVVRVPNWTDAGGWDDPAKYSTIQLADVNATEARS
jgi:hypothetical protein